MSPGTIGQHASLATVVEAVSTLVDVKEPCCSENAPSYRNRGRVAPFLVRPTYLLLDLIPIILIFVTINDSSSYDSAKSTEQLKVLAQASIYSLKYESSVCGEVGYTQRSTLGEGQLGR